ncbi:MAG: hypothetical protein A2X61_12465 [Ignavibacteria bacterium GWB2_35_12]|nr:MAG: hypothetical protein A2X63_07505 [Ignavibacteria bacterium GWA2_35_8]OGU41603.1 MAG: hypothetical protein A2X61_12465 [Ignavibacteria bacterium GWB2_35_12]OGU97221.1 MAG: hypothetical protein A2220_06105 [Ignavibacteria bacterium RIFOXYA2_FULL_35_10]OGV24936.1 MAG: hypothetical protein A2475_16310 [Ignavibacteria bacterium RIFOXYC2_FULL_35_21]
MKKIIYFILLFLCSLSNSFSQGGMRFPELEKKLEPYFAEDLIDDIKKQLPQGSDYSIWGWDVGDFSGDGFNDVALTIKISAEKKKTSHVYFFVDIDGFLTNLTEIPFDYVELPLEIGVTIRSNICFITSKIKQFNWIIRGYTFRNGTLILNEEFTTKRIKDFTHETHEDFSTLKNTEKYIKTIKNESRFYSDYLSIPCYQRGRNIYEGYASQVYDNYTTYVIKGAYYWSGEDDCSFWVSSAYDQEYIYMTIKIKDDNVVYDYYDFIPADNIEIWLDIKPPDNNEKDIVEALQNKNSLKTDEEKGIFNFKISLGDFLEKKAFVREVSSSDKLYKFQKEASAWIKASSSLSSDGYIVKFRIPLLLFGFDGPPIEEKKLTRFGCTVVVHDIDNRYRPEEETQIATSNFNPSESNTYGALFLVPQDMWYGEMLNIYRDEILKHLTELGY